jgi:hypothetical protein
VDPLLRQEYLQVMGVATYRARRPLPGARPSLPVPARRPQPVVRASQRPAVASLHVQQSEPAPSPRRELPSVDAAATVQAISSADMRPSGGSIQAPRYQLLVSANERLLVIADAAGDSAGRELAALLLGNLLRAVSDSSSYRSEFAWPRFPEHPELDQGQSAARQALYAMLERMPIPARSLCLVLGEKSLDCLGLAPGDQAQQCLGLPLLQAAAPVVLASDIAAKRALWMQMRTLLNRDSH